MPQPQSIRSGKPPIYRLFIAVFLPALLLVACADNSASMLNGRGPAAARINTLWWIMFVVGAIVYVVVMGYLLLALFRRRSVQEEDTYEPDEGTGIVIWGGAIIPAIILVGIYGATVFTLGALKEPEIAEELLIEVSGNQWWWDVNYPELGIRTANEIHIPVGQPVAIKLTSQDVIHSFWVPELHGKLDMIPGQVTEFWLEASEADTYVGECAEFCGVQHAKMQFLVIAQDEPEFLQWVEQQQQPAAEPADSMVQRGEDVFLGSTCIYCHAVEGTNATGSLGPDLTHVASRRALAAGTIANNRGNLAGWIVDPQSIKPGSLMPPTKITGPDLQALLTYLETLQ